MSRYLSGNTRLRALAAVIGIAFGAVLVAPVYAARSDAPAQAASSDSQITARVKEQLAGVPSLKGANVDVKTDDGVVTLSGAVKDRYAKSAATTAALTVEGVRILDDELKITSAPKKVADPRVGKAANRSAEDDRITADVRQLLAQSIPKRYKVDARTEHGVVYLSGDVMDGAAVERLRGMVAQVDGVKNVNTLGLDAPFVTMNY